MHRALRALVATVTTVAIALALLIITWPGLQGPLVHDSIKLHNLAQSITENGQVSITDAPAFSDNILGRRLSMMTFAANIHTNGGLNPYSLKATNIVIHILCGFAIFVLTRLLLDESPYARNVPLIAAFVAAVWLFSPVNISTALYTIQRMTQLSTLFTILGLISYVQLRQHPSDRKRLALYSGLFVAALTAAATSKENGVLLLLLAAVTELYKFGFRGFNISPRYFKCAFAASLVIIPFALMQVFPHLIDHSSKAFSLWQRLLTQPRVIMIYINQLLLPTGNDIGLYYDGLSASQGLLDPQTTLVSLIAVCGLGVLTWLLWHLRFTWLSYGLTFFFAAHALESTVLSLELFYLHRNYLPSFGLYLTFALSITQALYRIPRRAILYSLCAAYAVHFGVISYAKSLTWTSAPRIYTTAREQHPDSSRALLNYTQLLSESGRPKQAIDILDTRISRTAPGNILLHVQKLHIQCTFGLGTSSSQHDKLSESMVTVHSIELSQALGNLLNAYRQHACTNIRPEELIQALKRVADNADRHPIDPWTVEYYIFQLMRASHSDADSRAFLSKTLALGRIEAGLMLFRSYLIHGKLTQARRVRQKIIREFPQKQIRHYRASLEKLTELLDRRARPGDTKRPALPPPTLKGSKL